VPYDCFAGVVLWLVDEKEASCITEVGFPAIRVMMVIDHGGVREMAAWPQQNVGISLFTLARVVNRRIIRSELAPHKTSMGI
jgi:hypothetical protein